MDWRKIMIETVKCGDCRKGLFNVSFSGEDDKVTTFEQTTCPFCGSKSFQKEFMGRLSIGPIGLDESVNPTTIVDIESVSNTIFKVKVKKR